MSAPVPLTEITRYLDAYLRIAEIPDYPHALNGLQLQNAGTVSRIGAAVDGCLATIDAAADRGIDLLLVHHGMFWGGLQPLIGGQYRQWKRAMDANLAIYGAHLPLDSHPEVGNNAGLCAALRLGKMVPAFPFKGTFIGLRARVDLSRAELIQRLEAAVGGPVRVCPGGPEHVENVGVVTGGAGGEARAIAAEGIDTFITGEGAHWTYALAEELGMNILYGGHYATETFGVKALAAHLSERFATPWEFIDRPTGL